MDLPLPSLIIAISFLLTYFVQCSKDVELNCPDLFIRNVSAPLDGREPAKHKCFLDCITNEPVTLVCENVDFDAFITSSGLIPINFRGVQVILWNSPKLKDVDAGFFGPIKNRLKILRMINLPNLADFPMLRDRNSITEFSMENVPSLRYFAAESLPLNIERLVIFETGIRIFTADLNEIQPRNSLTQLIFSRQKVTAIGNRIMTLFPKLASLSFMSNNLSLTQLPEGTFFQNQKLKRLIFRENNFSTTPADLQKGFLQMFLRNFSLTENSVVDISYNGLPLNCTPQYCYSLNNVSALSLAGNSFGQFFTADGLFATFSNIKRLDASNTNFPRRKGTLRGLSKLEMLILGGNQFQDLVRTDIFFGCEAKLQILDLSDNNLLHLPGGSFKGMTNSLTELYLKKNLFHKSLLFSERGLPSPIPDSYDFSNLRILDLSHSTLKQFNGTWMSGLSRLTDLDVSCNSFRHISKEFFAGLPSSIRLLNMSFCVNRLKDVPQIDSDAFKGLGENNKDGSIQQLIISFSYLKGWIFLRLLAMPNATRAGLNILDLSDNRIYYLEHRHLSGFKQLTSLNLAGNYLQTIGKDTFSSMDKLASLNLARNKLASIETYEFDGMNSLIFLDLSNNNILHIDSGALDNIPQLQMLYLGKNAGLKSLNNMFDKGGQNLIHLGLQGNPFISLVNFPDNCISQFDLETLTSLKYIYIDNGTAIFVDHGTNSSSLSDAIKESPIFPNDPETMQCEFGIPNVSELSLHERSQGRQAVPVDGEPGRMAAWKDDFTRVVMQTPLDNLPRTFVTHIPKCFSHAYKNIAVSTASFLCPQSDSKTFQNFDDATKSVKKGRKGKR